MSPSSSQHHTGHHAAAVSISVERRLPDYILGKQFHMLEANVATHACHGDFFISSGEEAQTHTHKQALWQAAKGSPFRQPTGVARTPSRKKASLPELQEQASILWEPMVVRVVVQLAYEELQAVARVCCHGCVPLAAGQGTTA